MQILKNQKGITLVALTLTVIIMVILVSISVKFGTEAIEKSREEDIKSNMLLIQGKSKIIKDKHMYDSENSSLVGTPIGEASSFTVSTELQNKINSNENAEAYIFTQQDLNSNGLGNINVSSTVFYVVDYDTCEIYYSLGVNGIYALSEM